LVASGGADVKTGTVINADKLDMRLAVVRIYREINAKELSVDQNSGSGMTVSGTANKITIDRQQWFYLQGL